MIPILTNAIVMVIFVLFGLWVFLQGLRQLSLCMASRDWPRVSGQVDLAGVTEELARTHRIFVRQYVYHPYINYVYTIGAVKYHGSQRKFGEDESGTFSRTSNSEKRARAKIAKYLEAESFDVYYNPENPDEAVLEPGINATIITNLLAGFIVSTFGIGMLILSIAVCIKNWFT